MKLKNYRLLRMKYTVKLSRLVKGCLLLITLTVFQGHNHPCPAAAQNKTQRPSKTGDESPFDLQLKVVDRYQLRAALHNSSHRKQTFLYDVHLQPVELVLIAASGKHVPVFDSRSTMKFDNAAYRAMYKKLAAGKEELLQTERITAKDNSYTPRWSPYVFEQIVPGTYKAHLAWKSSLDRWKDSETSKEGKIKDIWKGTIESDTVTIEIPAKSLKSPDR